VRVNGWRSRQPSGELLGQCDDDAFEADVPPSRSMPSSVKNAVAASRSSTTMLTWSIR
jgi:hypothetical protein